MIPFHTHLARRPLSGYQANRQSPQFDALRWWLPMTDLKNPAGINSSGLAAFYYGSRIHHSDDMVSTGTPAITADSTLGAAFFADGADAVYNNETPPAALPASVDQASFTCWIKPADVSTSYRGVWQDNVAGTPQMLLSGHASHGLTYTWEFSADEFDGASTVTLTADRWYFVALTIEPTQAIVYGVDAIDGFRSWSNVKTHNTKTFAGFRIGTGSAGAWRGRIADMRIYERTLTAHDVWQMFAPATRWELYQTPRPRQRIEHVAAGGNRRRRFIMAGGGR